MFVDPLTNILPSLSPFHLLIVHFTHACPTVDHLEEDGQNQTEWRTAGRDGGSEEDREMMAKRQQGCRAAGVEIGGGLTKVRRLYDICDVRG